MGVIKGMTYDDMLSDAQAIGLNVREKPLRGYNGLIKGNRVAIKRDLPTTKHKACILAEEIGHYKTTVGNILDQDETKGDRQKALDNQKQEYRARKWAYDYMIGINGLISAVNNGCYTVEDMAEYLDVTEEYLLRAIDNYRGRYGVGVTYDGYFVQFEPYFTIFDLKEVTQ